MSAIVASLIPPQVYDHMGIFIDNGWTIRHCTSSKDRLAEERLWTTAINVDILGDEETIPVPVFGFRPDLVQFGWPGSITQSVEEVFYTGRNTKNAAWAWAKFHPEDDKHDPVSPKDAFFIYHLDPEERAKRLGFVDPELPDRRHEMITRLQDTPTLTGTAPDQKLNYPLLVRPRAELAAEAKPALALVVDAARGISAHYRFYGYTDTAITEITGKHGPSGSDPLWASLPPGAAWAAGTMPAMCSSFVWKAVQEANKRRPEGSRAIVLEDRSEPEDPLRGLEYGAHDGTYRYEEEERRKAAKILYEKIFKQVQGEILKKASPDRLAFLMLINPSVATALVLTPSRVANQLVNSFAVDKSEVVLQPLWENPGPGDAVSPDNVKDFWDFVPNTLMPESRRDSLHIYGENRQLEITPANWKRVPMFRKVDTPLGTGTLRCLVRLDKKPTKDAIIEIDLGCSKVRSSDPESDSNLREWNTEIELEEGPHFVQAWKSVLVPASGAFELFRSPERVRVDIKKGQTTDIVLLDLGPPPDLWRVLDIHFDAAVQDMSFWGGVADERSFRADPHIEPRPHIELRYDPLDDPTAPEDQRNSVLADEFGWRTEPEVGSGVHLTVDVKARLQLADRSIRCDVEVSLIDAEEGEVEHTEKRTDISVTADAPAKLVFDKFNFGSDDTVPERAQVTLKLANRRRPT